MKYAFYKLAEIATIKSGKRLPKGHKLCSEPTPYRYIQGRDIKSGRVNPLNLSYISKEAQSKISKYIVNTGDVLITVVANIGDVGYVTADLDGVNLTENAIRLTDYKDFVFPKYLSYLLSTPLYKGYMEGLAAGAAQAKLGIYKVKKINVALPDVSIQKKIVSLLNSFDNLIETNHRRIAILQEMAMRTYREWFMFYRFPGHESAKFSAGVPVSWKIAPIAELLEDYIGGGWGEENESKDYSVGGFVIRGSDIPSVLGGIPNKEIYRYHKKSNIASRQLEAGDIIFEVSGGSEKQPLGRNCLITKQLLSSYGDIVVCASFCKRLTPKSGYSEFLFGYLNQLWLGGLLDAYCVRITGISNFQFEAFLKYHKMLIPPKELTMKFAEFVSPIYNEICKIGSSIEHLRHMRDRLLPQLMSGQLEVKP